MIIGGGIVLGTLLFFPLSQTKLGKLSLSFDPAAVLFWAALLLTLGLLSGRWWRRDGSWRSIRCRPPPGEAHDEARPARSLRRPGRFAVATAILALIALLLMVLGGLLDGLVAGSTGALRAQRGQLIVYSSTSQESLVRSHITAPVRKQVEEVAGAGRVAGIGSVQLGARIDGHGPRDLVPVVLFGYQLAPRGCPGRCPRTARSMRTIPFRPKESRRAAPPSRPRPNAGPRDRLPDGQPLLRAGHPVGLARDMALGARRHRPSERAAAGVDQALVVRVAGGDVSGQAVAIIAPPAEPRRR